MARFLQLHFLTSYSPSNLNRDELGRPKTALFGGSQRLRVSSQSLKRAWRKSDSFEAELKGHTGTRTKNIGDFVEKQLGDKLPAGSAKEIATKISEIYGKDTLVFFAPAELKALSDLCSLVVKSKTPPTDEQLKALKSESKGAVDIALFGRMMAGSPERNVEAAAQVAHALSVHKVVVEDDYFTAIDDMNLGAAGSSHIGNSEFASAVLYHYVCVDLKQLTKNLGEDKDLVNKTVAALTRACLTVSPSGKQSGFASRARASFALAELSDFQPRSLAVSFLDPIKGDDVLPQAIKRLIETCEKFDTAYGEKNPQAMFNVHDGKGTLADLVKFSTTVSK